MPPFTLHFTIFISFCTQTVSGIIKLNHRLGEVLYLINAVFFNNTILPHAHTQFHSNRLLRFNRYFPFIPNENGDLMQYCECTNDFVNAIIDDYFNSFEIRKYYINKYEQPYYAVRISKLVEDDTGKVKRKYTYLAYFAKPEMAYTYLAEYNSGAVVPEHMKYSDSPTFAEMYEKWKKYRKSLKNQISDSTWRNYEIAFHHFSELHDRKFISIRTNDLQQCLNAYNHKWQTHLCFTHGQCRSK